jgi:serine/threonine protein kinase
MERYTLLGRIGEGAHGVVFKAKLIESGEVVALKKVSLRKLEDGLPNTAVREIKALKEIEEHENIVTLLDVFSHGPGALHRSCDRPFAVIVSVFMLAAPLSLFSRCATQGWCLCLSICCPISRR